MDDLDHNEAIKYCKRYKFKIPQNKISEHNSLIDIGEEESDQIPEKNCCLIEPMDLATGGSGYVLYLEMIRFFCGVFFIMTLVSSPILWKLEDLNNNWELYSGYIKYNPIAVLNLDKYSYASIYNGVSYNPTSNQAGNASMVGNWLYIFIGINFINLVIFCISVLIWSKKSVDIIEEVDDQTLTPSDYTLKISGIPADAKVDSIKDMIRKIYPQEIQKENIFVAKKFDNRINTFKNLLLHAKTLKDLRTQELRRLRIQSPHMSIEDLKNEIMEDDYEIKGCCSFSSMQKALENYKEACIACETVESDDENGYNMEDFANVEAYVTFTHEKATYEVLDAYLDAQECRWFIDLFTCCFVSKYPEHLTYTYSGQTYRYKIEKCDYEPGDLNWENLSVKGWEKSIRNWVFMVIVLVVSCVSFFAIWYGQNYVKKLPAPTNCTTTFSEFTPSIEHLPFAGFADWVVNKCATNDEICNYNSSSYKTINKNDELKYCYCIKEYNYLTANPSYSSMFYSICNYELSNYMKIQYAPLFVTLFTMIMNYVMLYTVLGFVSFTRPHSKTKEVAKATFYIYLTQFANMAIIPLVVYSTQEITDLWYQHVGISILNNFVLYSLTPNLSGLISPFIYLLVDWSQAEVMAVDQEDYNKFLAGPNLLEYVYVRYSYYLCFVTCCITFNASFPILLPVGFVGLLCMYYVEKLTLIYAYRKVDFSSGLNNYSNLAYSYMTIFQCLWIIWVYSNPYFMVTDASQVGSPIGSMENLWSKFLSFQNINDRHLRSTPFTIIFISIIIYRILNRPLEKLRVKIWNDCCREENWIEEEKITERPYDPNNMQSVYKTYDMLENTYYKRLIDAINADDEYKKSFRGSKY